MTLRIAGNQQSESQFITNFKLFLVVLEMSGKSVEI